MDVMFAARDVRGVREAEHAAPGADHDDGVVGVDLVEDRRWLHAVTAFFR